VVSEVALTAQNRAMSQAVGATGKGRAMAGGWCHREGPCHGRRLVLQGRAVPWQAVCRRPLTAESMVRRRTSPNGINGGHSGTGTGFAPSTSVFACQYHSNNTPYQSPSFIKLLSEGQAGEG